MDSQVENVKSQIDIVSLISEYIPLKKAGRNYKANCPFHSEKTPSFMVSPDRQIFKCFGCGEGGDVFAFLKRMEGMEFGEALHFLAQRVGIVLKEYEKDPFSDKKEEIFRINQLAAEMYQFLLLKHPAGERASAYLKARGLNQKSIDSFSLGFAPDKKNFLFQFLVKKGFQPALINLAGLSLSSSQGVVDRFRGRIIFPIKDLHGRIIAFSGRSLGSGEPKYLNSPETPVFNKSKSLFGLDLAKASIKRQKLAIFVEGNLDVISSHQIGVDNVVAPLGTALNIEHFKLIRKFTDNVVFAFDHDLAGDSATNRAIEISENSGMNIKVARITQGKDPDEVIKANPKLWRKIIEEAVPIYDFFVNSAIERADIKSAEGKRKAALEVLPRLARITDEILLSHYLTLLASKLGIEESSLRSVLARFIPGKAKTDLRELLEKPITEKLRVNVEKYYLALIIQSGELPKEAENLFEDAKLRDIFDLIKQFAKKSIRFRLKAFIKKLPASLLPVFDELLLLEIEEDILSSSKKLEQEFAYCAKRLKELSLRKRLKEISLAIRQAESLGHQKEVTSLTKEFQSISKVLTNNTN